MRLRSCLLAVPLVLVLGTGAAVALPAAAPVSSDAASPAVRPAPAPAADDKAVRAVRAKPKKDKPGDEVTPPPAPAPAAPTLDQLQARGTHNSTHRDPGHPAAGQVGWDYSHRRLAAQLEQQGVRQVEIDVHYNWAKDDFDVYHVYMADDRATCDVLADCLAELRGWQQSNPSSAPLMVLVEPKDTGAPYSYDLPEDGDPFTRALGAAEYAKLDRALLSAFGGPVSQGGHVLTPDDMTVPGRTLRESVLTRGWPTVDSLRGDVVLVLDGQAHAQRYSDGGRSLAGRAMFVQLEADTPVAAFVSRDGVRQPGESQYDRVRRLVAQGFLIRLLISTPEAEAAKASGAQWLSTDHPDELVLTGDPTRPVACNPVTAAADCTPALIEVATPGRTAVPTDPSDGTDQVVLDKVDRVVVGDVESVQGIAGGRSTSPVTPERLPSGPPTGPPSLP